MSDYTSQSGIYVIVHVKSGKVYIGKTARNFKERWQNHKKALRGEYHTNRHLQNAWNKYGEQSFKFQVLEYCPIKQLNEREKHHIAIYKARGLAYNLTDGGEGTTGLVYTEETRRKMSEAKKGRVHTEETRRKIGEAQKGHVPTDETRHKMSEARKNISEEARRKMSEANKGKVLTEETKQKLSEAQKRHHVAKRAAHSITEGLDE